MSGERPSESVLRAFEAGSRPLQLPGGQGTSWKAGGLVLKPSDGPVHQWLGEALDGLVSDGVRVAMPFPSSNGTWTVDGWGATSFVPGSAPDLSQPSTWLGVIAAGRAFHRAVTHIRRPAFVDSRDDPWAVADRVAWGERPMRFVPELADVAARLLAQPDRPDEPQLVHCNLTGNVLFADGLPPAVIDISPYWRPPSYAEGVVVADLALPTTVLVGLLSRCWVCLRRRLRERCSSEWRPPTSLLRRGPSLSTCLMKRNVTGGLHSQSASETRFGRGARPHAHRHYRTTRGRCGRSYPVR